MPNPKSRKIYKTDILKRCLFYDVDKDLPTSILRADEINAFQVVISITRVNYAKSDQYYFFLTFLSKIFKWVSASKIHVDIKYEVKSATIIINIPTIITCQHAVSTLDGDSITI